MFCRWALLFGVCLTFVVSPASVDAQSPTPAKRPGEKREPTPAKRPGTSDTKSSNEEASKVSASTVGSSAKTVSTKSVESASKDKLRRVERKELKETASTQGGEEYLLRYKMKPGMLIQSEVTHLAKTDTKVNDAEQNSHSRTVSHKTWKVIEANDEEMTFEYTINDIDMSQRIGADTEIRYNSKSGEEPARPFAAAAESVGKVISTVSIDKQGMIVARSDDTNPPNLGMGDITMPVPEKPVAVGANWEVPRELRIRRDDGTLKTVRFRELFRLDKVSAGVATIAVRSEMLTAIQDPKEEAQVLQQLSNGTIRFDVDAGRMLAKELAWDKTVVGFSGDGSVMDYSARLDDQVVEVK